VLNEVIRMVTATLYRANSVTILIVLEAHRTVKTQMLNKLPDLVFKKKSWPIYKYCCRISVQQLSNVIEGTQNSH
jgi:hypothetical protein